MTWEESIIMIREKPEYSNLIEYAYYESDLTLNIERYYEGQEYKEIKNWLGNLGVFSGKVLDVGSGNGVSAISFALDGFQVDAVEPDPSETVGAGAIRKLQDHYKLKKFSVHECFAEDVEFPDKYFDLVFARQSLHHANDLNKFIEESYRVLKPGGYMITVRDHVVFNAKDKEWFLESHPLHKYYGGENAYHPKEYEGAFVKAGFTLEKKYKHFESPVNYFPVKKEDLEPEAKMKKLKSNFKLKYSWLGQLSIFFFLYLIYIKFRGYSFSNDEMKVPGRMYSYIAKKA